MCPHWLMRQQALQLMLHRCSSLQLASQWLLRAPLSAADMAGEAADSAAPGAAVAAGVADSTRDVPLAAESAGPAAAEARAEPRRRWVLVQWQVLVKSWCCSCGGCFGIYCCIHS
jgi:hypothetical protein